jgi:Cadherin-like beta sandwich domain
MKKLLFIPAAAIVVLAALAGCAGMSRGHGPVESFMMPAAVNPGFSRDLMGALTIGREPKEVSFVVQPGTDLHSLVVQLALNTEATITVISTGARVVQQNGVTPNDFSSPVMYSIEVPGDKEPWKYRVTVREVETNPLLGMLRVPAGSSISPPFSPATHEYRMEVPFASTEVRMEARAQSRFAKSVSVDGKETPGPVGAAVVDFSAVSERAVAVEIVAEDGTTRDTYQITIVRGAPDSNAFLGSLDIQGVPYAPRFSPARLGYQATVPYETQNLLIRARPQSPFAAVTLTTAVQINGGVAQTTPFAATGDVMGPGGALVDFSRVDDLPLLVQVTAQDGSVQQYLVDIRRGPPDANNLLADLSLDSEGTPAGLLPSFAPTSLSYIATVPFSARRVRVMAHPQSRVAVLQVGGGFPASGGRAGFIYHGDPASPEGTVIDMPPDVARFPLLLQVTAQNGGVLRYVVELRRAPRPPEVTVQAQQVQPQPAPQPVQPQPAPVQPATPPTPVVTPPQQPPSRPPLSAGSDHLAVSAQNLNLGSREMAALTAAADAPGNTATVTVRPYRSSQIIVQDTTPLQVRRQGSAFSMSLRYKAPGVDLGKGRLIEIEIAVPTTRGKFLVYKEALPADHEVAVSVPFLIYSTTASIAWPAVGSPVQVSGYVSMAAEHPEEREQLSRNAKNESEIQIQVVDAKTGASYGMETVWRKPGVARGQSFAFTSPLSVPEGSAVAYTLTARAVNGRIWTAAGQGEVWTTRLRYEGGFEPVLLPIADALSLSADGKEKQGRDKDR